MFALCCMCPSNRPYSLHQFPLQNLHSNLTQYLLLHEIIIIKLYFYGLVEEIISGELKVSLSFDGTQIFSENLDLCQITQRGGHSCPLQKGRLKLSGTQYIPGYAPVVII